MTLYFLFYWLPGQSKIFSDPKLHVSIGEEEHRKALAVCEKKGYEIEYVSTREIKDQKG